MWRQYAQNHFLIKIELKYVRIRTGKIFCYNVEGYDLTGLILGYNFLTKNNYSEVIFVRKLAC